jgi:KaiC/GvpD/RAD55 family RecA-like ATPase
MLHSTAVSASTRNHRVQELQQLLEEQDQQVRDSQASEQKLERELHKLQRCFDMVETQLRALEAARATDREEHRIAMDQAWTEQARLRAQRDSLRQEITSLRRQLADARQATALVLSSMCVTASASGEPSTQRAAIDCPSGYVCIYPEINFGGQPWGRRASDGSVKDLPSAIRDRGSSVRNNSDRTARVYEKRNHAGRWVSPSAAAPSTTCVATTSTTRPAP